MATSRHCVPDAAQSYRCCSASSRKRSWSGRPDVESMWGAVLSRLAWSWTYIWMNENSNMQQIMMLASSSMEGLHMVLSSSPNQKKNSVMEPWHHGLDLRLCWQIASERRQVVQQELVVRTLVHLCSWGTYPLHCFQKTCDDETFKSLSLSISLLLWTIFQSITWNIGIGLPGLCLCDRWTTQVHECEDLSAAAKTMCRSYFANGMNSRKSKPHLIK